MPSNNAPILKVRDSIVIHQGTSVNLRNLIIEASDEERNDLRSNVVINGEVNSSKSGAYTIHYSLTDKNGNTAYADSTISVKGKNTVMIGDNAIDAHDFSVSIDEIPTLTKEQILIKAGINAWNIPTGKDLSNIVQIDKTQLKNNIGQYKIAISVDLLKAVLGKDSLGNDAAIIIVTVYNNNNQTLPTTGEDDFDTFINIFKAFR